MNATPIKQWLPSLVASSVVLLCGCAVGPDYHPPQTSVPSTYGEKLADTNGPAEASLDQWWRLFHDAELDALIREARVSNYDIRIAGARVREARAEAGIAQSALLPSIDADGAYTRERLSKNTPNGFVAQAAGQSLVQNFYSAGFDASWEIDVFGGNRRALEAAGADVGASVESGRDVLVTVLGDVGLNYLDLRGLQKELAVTRDNLRLQQETLKLTQDQFKAGLATEVDTARAEAQTENTLSQIPLLEESIESTIHRLAVLTGKQPGELESELSVAAPIPSAIPSIPVEIPSDLLQRRPDIREAEREVAASTARIGVAKADLFPKFTLASATGLQSISAGKFFDAESGIWSFGPSMSWPVFAGGRIRQNIKVQNARQEQALDRYQQTVLASLEEVENSLVACNKELEHHDALARSEAADRRAADLAEERYRSGLEDFLDVLETQRTLLAVQDDLAQSERNLGQNVIRLYKALGGGWESTAEMSGIGNKPDHDWLE
ncbi:MAG TPA: efflux transporter outer membrane subunit [Verrucomicrobiae bacterium]|jgi:NodT family efflux transporter outer membrane factor (OMF) lipoprotein|nr:efflux transporter outer membrane subunit [Verrucomicrobiae bacterium]